MEKEPRLAERVRLVQGRPVTIQVDEEHLCAHAADFFVPFEEILSLVARAIAGTSGHVQSTLSLDAPIGLSRCVRITASSSAFWGLRDGRTYPSHLVRGEPQATSSLCVWGDWIDQSCFRLLTVYPGEAAPREIHDPKIPLGELDDAIAFWTAHALIQ